MVSKRIAPCIALGLGLLLGGGTLVTQARQANDRGGAPVSGTIAVVDMDRLFEASGGPGQLQEKELELFQEAKQRADIILAAPFLDEAERGELIGLCRLAKPTEAQQTRMKELRGLSDQRAAELQKLETTPNDQLKPADRTRIQELREQNNRLRVLLPELQNAFMVGISEQKQFYRRELYQRLREVVSQVAKEKRVDHVFDALALVYSTTDLTPLAIQKVTKKR
jgi:Skp family chaperone for outer membrane proteins